MTIINLQKYVAELYECICSEEKTDYISSPNYRETYGICQT